MTALTPLLHCSRECFIHLFRFQHLFYFPRWCFQHFFHSSRWPWEHHLHSQLPFLTPFGSLRWLFKYSFTHLDNACNTSSSHTGGVSIKHASVVCSQPSQRLIFPHNRSNAFGCVKTKGTRVSLSDTGCFQVCVGGVECFRRRMVKVDGAGHAGGGMRRQK